MNVHGRTNRLSAFLAAQRLSRLRDIVLLADTSHSIRTTATCTQPSDGEANHPVHVFAAACWRRPRSRSVSLSSHAAGAPLIPTRRQPKGGDQLPKRIP